MQRHDNLPRKQCLHYQAVGVSLQICRGQTLRMQVNVTTVNTSLWALPRVEFLIGSHIQASTNLHEWISAKARANHKAIHAR